MSLTVLSQVFICTPRCVTIKHAPQSSALSPSAGAESTTADPAGLYETGTRLCHNCVDLVVYEAGIMSGQRVASGVFATAKCCSCVKLK